MSTLRQRVRQELQTAQEELEALRQENCNLAVANDLLQHENARLQRQTHLAYIEGLDQGRAQAIHKTPQAYRAQFLAGIPSQGWTQRA